MLQKTSLQELHGLAGSAKVFLSTQLVDFLEMKHAKAVDKKLQHEAASQALKPAETFELEIKHKMSNAAHEILQAINRIEDCQRQNSELDTVDYLRYARVNLEEAAKELEAAEKAYKGLEKYQSRIDRASSVLSHELAPVIVELFEKLEKLWSFQKTLYEKTVLMINQIGAC
ncbi:MAG: hypothetical protein QW063_02615 [Candidatus Nanoarchaeia archaeon]